MQSKRENNENQSNWLWISILDKQRTDHISMRKYVSKGV